MNPLYVGIDVESKSNVVYLILPDAVSIVLSVANSQDGSTQLVKHILSAITSLFLDTVIIGLKATSVYGNNFVYFLKEMPLWYPMTGISTSSIPSKLKTSKSV